MQCGRRNTKGGDIWPTLEQSAPAADRAYVELFADDNPLSRGLAIAANKLKIWGASISALGAKTAGIGALIVAPLLAAAKSFATAGSMLNDAADRTGFAVEDLSALKFIVEQNGSNFEELEVGIKKFQKAIVQASEGSKEARKALDDLGLSAEELSKLTGLALMEKLADGLQKIENPAKRAELAMALMGRSGTKLIPALKDGAAGLRAYTDAAQRAGLIMTATDARAADALGDAFDKLTATVKAAWNVLGAQLAPVLMDLFAAVQPMITGTIGWIRANRDLFAVLLKLGGALLGAGAGIFLFGKAVSLVGTVLKFMIPGLSPFSTLTYLFKALPAIYAAARVAILGVAAAFQVLATATGLAAFLTAYLEGMITVLTVAFNPLVLLAAALAGGIGYLVYAFVKTNDSVRGFGAAWEGIKGAAIESWHGIIAAIAAGDMQNAFDIAIAGMKLAWLELFATMKSTWLEFQAFAARVAKATGHEAVNVLEDSLRFIVSLPYMVIPAVRRYEAEYGGRREARRARELADQTARDSSGVKSSIEPDLKAIEDAKAELKKATGKSSFRDAFKEWMEEGQVVGPPKPNIPGLTSIGETQVTFSGFGASILGGGGIIDVLRDQLTEQKETTKAVKGLVGGVAVG